MSLAVDVRLPGRLTASLDLGDGITAVVGPNGSGKSSLLYAVAGILSASVRVAGREWTGLPAPERRVGLVHQDHQLFPHLTVLANVAFGPRARGSSRRAARARAAEEIERIGIPDLRDRYPHQLSGGQAQRVALARALATDPEVLLLDEPFAALDVAVAEELRQLLLGHLPRFPGPVLLATHDTLDLTELATHVVVLEHGAVAQSGPLDVVAESPATSHAARLLGLNVLSGIAGTDGTIAAGDELTIVAATTLDGPVLATFAPNAVTLTADRPTGSARNAWPAQVIGTVTIGSVVRVHLRTDSGWDLRADVTPTAAGRLGLTIGRQTWASVKATEVTVFSRARPTSEKAAAR